MVRRVFVDNRTNNLQKNCQNYEKHTARKNEYRSVVEARSVLMNLKGSCFYIYEIASV